MSSYALLLFLHLVGVLALAAGVGASLACKSMALRVDSPAAVAALLRTARVAVHRCAMPGSIVLLFAGVGLVRASNGVYELNEPWIIGAVVMWAASALVGVRMHAPRSRTALALAVDLHQHDLPVTERLRAIIRAGRPASLLDTSLLLGMVALMIFKPGH